MELESRMFFDFLHQLTPLPHDLFTELNIHIPNRNVGGHALLADHDRGEMNGPCAAFCDVERAERERAKRRGRVKRQIFDIVRA